MFSCRTWLRKEIEPKKIHGVITHKSDNRNCVGILDIVHFDNSIDSLKFCTCLQYRTIWDGISEGDTIVKDKNTIHLQIHNGKKNMNFDYPCCDQ